MSTSPKLKKKLYNVYILIHESKLNQQFENCLLPDLNKIIIQYAVLQPFEHYEKLLQTNVSITELKDVWGKKSYSLTMTIGHHDTLTVAYSGTNLNNNRERKLWNKLIRLKHCTLLQNL